MIVTVVVPLMAVSGYVAVTEVLPTSMPVTTPRVVTTFDTEAIATFAVDQVTSAVTSFVELSLYVAVAFICRVRPWTTVGLAGVRVIETSAAFVTVSVVDELTPLFE